MSVAIPWPRRPIRHVYDAAYTGVPNWDIGRPQAAFVDLQEAGYVADPVLDLGCGTGELSIYLARMGHRVLGIDLSPVAIARARRKAGGRRVRASFLVMDALDVPALRSAGLVFGTVVDSAMFHVLGDRERDRLAAGLEEIVRSGGRYCVLGDVAHRSDPRYGISPGELERRFEAVGDWELEFAIETVFERRWGDSPAYFVGLRRQ